MVYSFSSFIYYLSININYLTLSYSIFKSSFVVHSTFIGLIFLLITCSLEINLCLFESKTAKINLFSIVTMLNYAFILIITVVEGIHSSIKKDYISKNFQKKIG